MLVVPIVIDTLRIIPKSFDRNLEELKFLERSKIIHTNLKKSSPNNDRDMLSLHQSIEWKILRSRKKIVKSLSVVVIDVFRWYLSDDKEIFWRPVSFLSLLKSHVIFSFFFPFPFFYVKDGRTFDFCTDCRFASLNVRKSRQNAALVLTQSTGNGRPRLNHGSLNEFRFQGVKGIIVRSAQTKQISKPSV